MLLAREVVELSGCHVVKEGSVSAGYRDLDSRIALFVGERVLNASDRAALRGGVAI